MRFFTDLLGFVGSVIDALRPTFDVLVVIFPALIRSDHVAVPSVGSRPVEFIFKYDWWRVVRTLEEVQNPHLKIKSNFQIFYFRRARKKFYLVRGSVPWRGIHREYIVKEHSIGLTGALVANEGARVHWTFVADGTVPARRPVPNFESIIDTNPFQGLRW
jgi:hypothetical protein